MKKVNFQLIENIRSCLKNDAITSLSSSLRIPSDPARQRSSFATFLGLFLMFTNGLWIRFSSSPPQRFQRQPRDLFVWRTTPDSSTAKTNLRGRTDGTSLSPVVTIQYRIVESLLRFLRVPLLSSVSITRFFRLFVFPPGHLFRRLTRGKLWIVRSLENIQYSFNFVSFYLW